MSQNTSFRIPAIIIVSIAAIISLLAITGCSTDRTASDANGGSGRAGDSSQETTDNGIAGGESQDRQPYEQATGSQPDNQADDDAEAGNENGTESPTVQNASDSGVPGVEESPEDGATLLSTAYYSVLLPDSLGSFDYSYDEGAPAGDATGDGSPVTHQLLVRFIENGNKATDCFYVGCSEWPMNVDGPVLWADTGVVSPDGLAVVIGTPYDTDLSEQGWDVVEDDANSRLSNYMGCVVGAK